MLNYKFSDLRQTIYYEHLYHPFNFAVIYIVVAFTETLLFELLEVLEFSLAYLSSTHTKEHTSKFYNTINDTRVNYF